RSWTPPSATSIWWRASLRCSLSRPGYRCRRGLGQQATLARQDDDAGSDSLLLGLYRCDIDRGNCETSRAPAADRVSLSAPAGKRGASGRAGAQGGNGPALQPGRPLVQSTTAIISISTIASGWARPLIWIVVLVGLAIPKYRMRTSEHCANA